MEKILKGKKILIIDDDRLLLNVLEEFCEILDALIIVTKVDPIEALEYYRENTDIFDVVVSDIQMPGISGIELVDELLKLNPKQPLVLMSAKIESYSYGIDKVSKKISTLSKPFTLDEFEKAINSAIGAFNE